MALVVRKIRRIKLEIRFQIAKLAEICYNSKKQVGQFIWKGMVT